MFTEIHFMYTLKITDSSSFRLYLDIDQLFNPHLFSIFTWAWIHTHTHTSCPFQANFWRKIWPWKWILKYTNCKCDIEYRKKQDQTIDSILQNMLLSVNSLLWLFISQLKKRQTQKQKNSSVISASNKSNKIFSYRISVIHSSSCCPYLAIISILFSIYWAP